MCLSFLQEKLIFHPFIAMYLPSFTFQGAQTGDILLSMAFIKLEKSGLLN
jgi:hypothetical protein